MKRSISALLAIILAVFSLSFASCAENTLYSEGDGELNVVCTTFIPFDLARIIGGEDVKVTILQDSGADLHNYSPTTATLSALSEADIFIYIGGESDEKWVPDAINACKNEELIALCLLDAIEEPIHAELENDWTSHEHESSEEHEGHDHHADEHIWTSLKNACAMVRAIRDAMCKSSPDQSQAFISRADSYLSELEALDSDYTAAVDAAKVRFAVVADRFPFVYLFHDYKIAYIAAFSGCSTEVNASFETQVSLIEAVRANGTGCVITIEGSDKALAEAVARETGCKILSLNSMQSIKRSDIESGASYIDITKANLLVLKEALG